MGKKLKLTQLTPGDSYVITKARPSSIDLKLKATSYFEGQLRPGLHLNLKSNAG